MAEYIVRVVSCESCIHCEVCKRWIEHSNELVSVRNGHQIIFPLRAVSAKLLCGRYQPAADVVEVRHGHWYSTEYEYFTCSECGNSFYNGCESTAEAKQRLKDGLYDNYCGHCGAKMDGKGEGE